MIDPVIKADIIVKQFYSVSIKNTMHDAKKCAIISINQTIEAIKEAEEFVYECYGGALHRQVDYWEEVKNKIF